MTTTANVTKVPELKQIKSSLFTSYLKKQKTTTYPDTLASSRSNSSSNIVRTLAWAPLGNLIATATGDRTLRIWNPEKSGIRSSTELRGHSGTIDRLAWNPAKEAELASCGTDGTVRFWDARSKSSTGEVKLGGECFTLSWAPDGSELVVGRKDDTLIRVSRSALSQLSTHRQPTQTNQTALSWSGKELLLTTGDGQVKILDYPSLEPLHTITAHTSSCYCIALAPTGAYVATGGSDALITLWDTTDFVCRRTFDRAAGLVRTLSFSCDGSYLVGGSDEGTGVDIMNVETGEYMHKIETPGTVPCVQWSPKDYSLAYAPGEGGGGLKIIGSVTGS